MLTYIDTSNSMFAIACPEHNDCVRLRIGAMIKHIPLTAAINYANMIKLAIEDSKHLGAMKQLSSLCLQQKQIEKQ